VKLLLDEMWSPVIAERLRLRGHDVEAVAARNDLVGQPDIVVFAVAQRERRAIVTEDLGHFRAIANDEIASGGSHAGLILTHPQTMFRGGDRSIGRVVTALTELIEANEDLINREIWLS
jgi:hypothetical protein